MTHPLRNEIILGQVDAGPDGVEMVRTAHVSPDRRYRYSLTRCWDPGLPLQVWVMLNPSTADAHTDDQTVRKCVGFAQRGGFGMIGIVNLFPIRTSNPAELVSFAADYGIDLRGDFHDRSWAARSLIADAEMVVFGWGSSIPASLRPAAAAEIRAFEVLCKTHGVRPMCLGRTADGSPRHPSRPGYNTPFELWKVG